MEQEKEKYDFTAFGQGIKAARKAKGLSRNALADILDTAPRYIAAIENDGRVPSISWLHAIVRALDLSVDQFFFPEKVAEKSTQRRQLESLLDEVSETGLQIITATAKEIVKVENEGK